MPDFELVPQASATFRTMPWTDPRQESKAAAIAASGAGSEAAFDALPEYVKASWLSRYPPKPSRVTTIQARERFAWTANLGTWVEVWVKPDGGVAGGPDSDFAGRVPYAWFVETPYGPDSPSYVPGTASRLYFTPSFLGHYALVVRRDEGGAVVLHIDVINPAAPPP